MNKTPAVRFIGFAEDWEQRKLGDIYGSIGNAFVGTATPYYVEQGHFYLESNNVKDGQINHNSVIFINDEFYEKQKDKWLHTGDMVMVQSGHVGHAAVIPEELDDTAAHALIMFRNPKEEIEPYFLNYEYQTDKAKKKIEHITTGNTIKHILASDMQEFVVDLPKYEEQKVIAGYFCNIDNLITLHQRKYDKLTNVKKSMLGKMFPQNGSNVPEIRFKGFTEAWEQRKFDEVFDCTIPNNTLSRAELNYESGSVRNIHYGDILIKYGSVVDVQNDEIPFATGKSSDDFKGALLRDGDIIIADTAEDETTGKACEIGNSQGLDVVSGLHTMVCRPRNKMALGYLGYYLNSDAYHHQLLPLMQGIKVLSLSRTNVQKTMVCYPKSKAEQQLIADCFRNLDNLITLHHRKLEKLEQIKQAMLHKMFV